MTCQESEHHEFLNNLNNLDFGPLAYKLIYAEDRPGLSLEQAVDAIKKYKGFLLLCHAYQDKKISPSRYIDYVWHAHILDTELYAVQTAMLFGHYLHHFPFFGKKDDNEKTELLDAASFTKNLAASYFGWDDDDWCGTGRHPHWPKPKENYITNLASVLYPDSGICQQALQTKNTISVQAGNFKHTIEYVGSLSDELSPYQRPPSGVCRPPFGFESGLMQDLLPIIQLIKLPSWVIVCMPVPDIKNTTTFPIEGGLVEIGKYLLNQRLIPEGFSNDLVHLDIINR